MSFLTKYINPHKSMLFLIKYKWWTSPTRLCSVSAKHIASQPPNSLQITRGKATAKTWDAFCHAEMQCIILFALLIDMNGVTFTLNERLGRGGPTTQQKSASAVFASSVLTWGQQNKRWQQRSLCEPRLLQDSWWCDRLNKDIKQAVGESYLLINYLVYLLNSKKNK